MKPCTFQNMQAGTKCMLNELYTLRFVFRYQEIKQIADEYDFEVAIVKLIVKKILIIRIQIRY